MADSSLVYKSLTYGLYCRSLMAQKLNIMRVNSSYWLHSTKLIVLMNVMGGTIGAGARPLLFLGLSSGQPLSAVSCCLFAFCPGGFSVLFTFVVAIQLVDLPGAGPPLVSSTSRPSISAKLLISRHAQSPEAPYAAPATLCFLCWIY